MTNKDIVLHSTDPYLLMRMFTELQMDGRFDCDYKWNNGRPFLGEHTIKIYKDNVVLFVPNFFRTKEISLTEKNYLSTLKMILE